MSGKVRALGNLRAFHHQQSLGVALVALLASLAIGSFAWWRGDPGARRIAGGAYPASPAAEAEQFRPIQVVPRQEPLTNFEIVSAGRVGKRINPAELVIGVTVNQQARAYPLNMLTGPTREILNDQLGGAAIAATW